VSITAGSAVSLGGGAHGCEPVQSTAVNQQIDETLTEEDVEYTCRGLLTCFWQIGQTFDMGYSLGKLMW
jgi:hypothetical protein